MSLLQKRGDEIRRDCWREIGC